MTYCSNNQKVGALLRLFGDDEEAPETEITLAFNACNGNTELAMEQLLENEIGIDEAMNERARRGRRNNNNEDEEEIIWMTEEKMEEEEEENDDDIDTDIDMNMDIMDGIGMDIEMEIDMKTEIQREMERAREREREMHEEKKEIEMKMDLDIEMEMDIKKEHNDHDRDRDDDNYKMIHIANIITNSTNNAKPKKDCLHEKEIRHIESIQDRNARSTEILQMALKKAALDKVEMFIELMERFHGQYDITSSFTYEGYTEHMLTHLTDNIYGVNNVKCLRYLLGSEIRSEITPQQVSEALNRAMIRQNEQAIRAILSYEYLDDTKKTTREYALKHSREKSKIELLLHYMKSHLKDKEFETIMNGLEKVMIAMIKDRKILSNDIFNLLWVYKKKNIWKATLQKLKHILKMETLSKSPNDLEWIKYHLLDISNSGRGLLCWLDEEDEEEQENENEEKEEGDNDKENKNNNSNDCDNKRKTKDNNGSAHHKTKLKWHSISQVCQQEMSKESFVLQQQLKAEIDKNEQIFAKIVKFHCDDLIDPIYIGEKNRHRLRQDFISKGFAPRVRKQKLQQASVFSGDFTYDALYSYDYDVYLNELIQRAHFMNGSFQKEMESFFSSVRGCKFEGAPVKTAERSRTKAQTEHAKEKFPKSAHIIDMVRCSVTFERLTDFYEGMIQFKEFLAQQKINLKNKHTMKENQHKPYFELMRVKNGFQIPNEDIRHLNNENTLSHTLQLPIPNTYTDVRFNVIFTDPVNNRAIIGEVQFLLKSISASKKKQQKFYEIIRQTEFMEGAYHQHTINTFEFQLKLAGFNPKFLSPLMLYYPLHFGTSKYVNHATDVNGKTFTLAMAYNDKTNYQNVRELLLELMDKQAVQRQLLQTNSEGIYAFMYALWKGACIDTIKLYIPKDMNQNLWATVDRWGYSALLFAVRNTEVGFVENLEFLKANLGGAEFRNQIVTPERFQNFTPLLFTFLLHAKITDEMMKYIIPENYRENTEFWEMKTTENHDLATVIHYAVESSNNYIKDRLRLLKHYMPAKSWQNCIAFQQKHGYTPLMSATRYCTVLDDELMELLIPENAKFNSEGEIAHNFWNSRTSDKSILKGGNILHLSLFNQQPGAELRLKMLRKHIPKALWNSFLHCPDSTLLQETPIDMAIRLEKPLRVLKVLQDHRL